jgi:hypothetical protein
MSPDHGAMWLDIVTTSPGGDQISLALFSLERDVVAISMDSGAMPGGRITGWLDIGTIYEIIDTKSKDIGAT